MLQKGAEISGFVSCFPITFTPWLAGDGLVWLQSLILGLFFGGEGYRRMTVAETMSASPSRGEEWFFNFKRMGQKSKISWPTIFLNGV